MRAGAGPSLEGQPVPSCAHLPPAIRGRGAAVVHLLEELGQHLGQHADLAVRGALPQPVPDHRLHDAVLDLQEDQADGLPCGLEL